MDERDRETIKLVASIMGNVAAIAVGVAIFEKTPFAMYVACFFALLAVFTIRELR
ncbi:MAG: hypothetical protein IJU37_05645 [Desulfovibrio sp.]|nr:hypothetical protein [Desulfovibrio sp.]